MNRKKNPIRHIPMKKTLLVALLLITVNVFSQKNIQVLYNEKVYGKHIASGYDIVGVEYSFPERIQETFLDTTSGYLTAQLRGVSKNGKWLDNVGDIVQYDLNNRQVLWSKNIAYQVGYLQQFSNAMIYTVGGKSYCLDIHNGNDLWEVKNNIYLVDPDLNIGIGYRFRNSTGFTNELEGIDLKNGNKLWSRELNREYGWNNAFYTDDSTLIVVAAGLHSLNPQTGKGWDYEAITGKKDYKGTAAANAIGVAAGLLTGTFFISTGHDLVRDLVSNILLDSANLYFASNDKIVKIDRQTGDVVWKFLFGKDISSKSSIFYIDSTVFMVNKAMAFMGERQLKIGEPFFAAFNRNTGEQLFFNFINIKDEPVLDFQVRDNEIFLVFKNRMMKYSLTSGLKIADREFPADQFGDLNDTIGDQVFITTPEGNFISLPQTDSTKLFIYSSQQKVLSIDSNLEVSGSYDLKDLNVYYLRLGEYKFFNSNDKTQVVNGEGVVVAEIEASANAFAIGNTLYDTRENKFIVIDLNKLK